MTSDKSRRDFLTLMAALPCTLTAGSLRGAHAAEGSGDDWNQGDLAHLIPMVNHNTFLVKTSFRQALQAPPRLHIGESYIAGMRTDTEGRFWQFHARNLQPDTLYELQLEQPDSGTRTDPWSLKTFPAPDAAPDHLRIFAYTCAGGNEKVSFLNMADRRRLLRRGLSFNPDVVIANGDHIYWDQKTMGFRPEAFQKPWLELFKEYGSLDRDLPILGSSNELILKQIADDQIAVLYGVTLRSVPVFMPTDDHDMFENDEAHDSYISLPPDRSMLDAARTTQRLYYPEFLPDATRDSWLPGSGPGRGDDLSEVFGTLRFGRLFECLIYDTKRYVSLKGPSGTMIPPSAEKWLAARTTSEDTAHLVHMPSTPIGWSAGKWGEWYPDLLQEDGRLGIAKPKPYWPSGWWSQHQRIIEMLSSQKNRLPTIMSGDLHALSYGQITKSGSLDLRDNPVHAVCVGPLGSSGPGFPSRFRGTGAKPPSSLSVDESLKPLEKNGFSIIDVSPEKMTIRFFAWLPPEPSKNIDTMNPLAEYEIAR